MQDKLQELTDRLYNEGLSKGKQDGEALLKKAHGEADRIVATPRPKPSASSPKPTRKPKS